MIIKVPDKLLDEQHKLCPPLTPGDPGTSQEFSLMFSPRSMHLGEAGSWGPGTQAPESNRQTRPSSFTQKGKRAGPRLS